jgi:hypothetical protein
MASHFAHSFHADPSAHYDSTGPVPEGFTTLRFESLQDSRIQDNVFLHVARHVAGRALQLAEAESVG